MPKVSVIMGVYNGAHKVEGSVSSILNQSFKDFELIICDDGSTDNSINVLQNLAKQDNRIKLLINKTNLGLAKTLNNCIDASKGEYIARMDDDDYSLQNRIEKQVEFLDSHLQYDIVGSTALLFDEKGVYGQRGKFGEIFIEDVLKGHSFIHPTIIMRKQRLIELGGYTDSIETLRTEDLDLWYKFYKAGRKGYVLSESLLKYYESIESMKRRRFKYRINEYRIRRNIYNSFDLHYKMIIYVFKPIIVGLLPNVLIKTFHSNRQHRRD